MKRKNISQEKIIQSFLSSAFEKGAGGTSLSDISDSLEIKKASLYNHFENREAMYDATLDLCRKEISSINFLADKIIESIKNGKTSLSAVFKRLITRFFNLYETEPLFQIYTFVHTEQFFNYNALQIVLNENEKITDDIRKIFIAFSETGKFPEYPEKETRELAGIISSIILQQRDLYIANRKETVRQNPESGAGSLFALPTDDIALNKTIKLIDNIINKVI
ncbi:MAG: TetR/AcrR family transcriptional regulator [Treponema sp.]|nr:TetR/AcrR family transcriptional regulator [Treponema sp.]